MSKSGPTIGWKVIGSSSSVSVIGKATGVSRQPWSGTFQLIWSGGAKATPGWFGFTGAKKSAKTATTSSSATMTSPIIPGTDLRNRRQTSAK